MCGIAGVVARSPSDAPALTAELGTLLGPLRHRGPDSTGIHCDGQVALGMHRLSIIDLATGDQPFFGADGTVVSVTNGEIYNYADLRRLLLGEGAGLRSSSDCEVIPHLYERDGLGFVHHLRGMFAVALWDGARRRLVLARDRMGEKPLYYTHMANRFGFASELKALLAHPGVDATLDRRQAFEYFHYGYVPEPATIVAGVQKLPAAHILVLDLDTWQVSVQRYWSMLDADPIDADPASTIAGVLSDFAPLVTHADVPVAVALSGGLDSSLVAAMVAGASRHEVLAITAGYPGRGRTDERADAARTAELLGLSTLEVEIPAGGVVDEFDATVAMADDPISDIAAFGYLSIMRAAADKGIKVVLLGQGGDELFWGYPWATEVVRLNQQRAALRRGELGPAGYLSHWPQPFPRGRRRATARWLASAAGLTEAASRYAKDRRGDPGQLIFYELAEPFRTTRGVLDALFPRAFLADVGRASVFDRFRVPVTHERFDLAVTQLLADTYLIGNGLALGDRLSMAASVEGRVPLVDHILTETVVGLRTARPDVALGPKAWLRDVAETILPAEVIERPKRGFQPPVVRWIHELLSRSGSTLVDGALVQHGLIRPTAARALAVPAVAPTPWGQVAYQALVLETWCRRYL